MAPFRTALVFLVAALFPLSRAIHFTNTQWDLHENESFLLQWGYDASDPINGNSARNSPAGSGWRPVIWLFRGAHHTDAVVIYNETYSPNVTSYEWEAACTYGLTQGSSYDFGIALSKYSYGLSGMNYSADWTLQQAGDFGSCSQAQVQTQDGNNDEGLSSGSIIAIAVTLSLAAVCCAVVGLFYWRIQVARKQAAMGLKPVDQSIALQDRTADTAGTTAATGTTGVGGVADTTSASDATPQTTQRRTTDDRTEANEGISANEATAADEGTATDERTASGGRVVLSPAYGDGRLQIQHIHGDPPPYSP